VVAGEVSAAQCVASGDGLRRATAKVAAVFLVRARDADGGEIGVGGDPFAAFIEGEGEKVMARGNTPCGEHG
jgi:hypothetical protein